MNDMTPAAIGHNGAPDTIELVLAKYDGTITEAQNWADGKPVTDEAGMKAVDAVIKEFKTYKSALKRAGEERTKPLHQAHQEAVKAVKVYTDDATRIQAALVATVAPYKEKLAAEKEEQRKQAAIAAANARAEAEAAAAKVNEADIDAQREAAAKLEAAKVATATAAKANKDTVKGMRTVTKYAIESHKEALNDIAKNDRDAMTAFIEEYVRKNHKVRAINGVRVWQEKEAY